MATTRGFTSDLARKMGVSPSNIAQYVKGDRIPGLDTLDRFAEALGIEPWELLRPEGAQPTPPKPSPTVEALTKVIEEQERRLRELERFVESIPSDVLADLARVKDWEAVRTLVKPLAATPVRSKE